METPHLLIMGVHDVRVYLSGELLIIRVGGKQYHASEGEGVISWNIKDKNFDPKGIVLTGPMLFKAIQELNKGT